MDHFVYIFIFIIIKVSKRNEISRNLNRFNFVFCSLNSPLQMSYLNRLKCREEIIETDY